MNKTYSQDFPGGLVVKTAFFQWRRKCQPTPVFLPGKPHAQRSLVGYIVHAFARSQTQLKGLSTSISD